MDVSIQSMDEEHEVHFKEKSCFLLPSELPSYGLPPGDLHHSHVSQEAGLDNSFRGECPGWTVPILL